MSIDMYIGLCIGFVLGGLAAKFLYAWRHRNWQPKPKKNLLGDILGMEVAIDEKLPADHVRLDHPDGRSEEFVLRQPKQEKR